MKLYSDALTGAICEAVDALAVAQGETDAGRKRAALAQAARWVAAAQAANDTAPAPAPDPPAEPPGVTLARLQGQIAYMHHGAAGSARPLWAALATLAGVVDNILRRLPPDP